MNVEKIRQIVAHWASGLGRPCNIYLYGSYVEGTAIKDSDVDIAIEFPHILDGQSPFWASTFNKWEQDLSKQIGSKVHLEPYDKKKTPHVKKYIDKPSTIKWVINGKPKP